MCQSFGARLNTLLNHSTYLHRDSAIWVTLVHGEGGSSSLWFKQLAEFKKHYNVLLVDLRDHGDSKLKLKNGHPRKYTFDLITDDVVAVLQHLKIKKSHFIGNSIGTVIIRNIAECHPSLVESMVLSGAIVKLGFRARALLSIGNLFKSVIPYLWLYRFFTFLIMPYSNHRESRVLHLKEAKKLNQQEFLRWSSLTTEMHPLLKKFKTSDSKIPTLYVMGGQDYLFLPAVKKEVQKHETASLLLIEHCGHVVNIQQSDIFNRLVINYVSDISWESVLVEKTLRDTRIKKRRKKKKKAVLSKA